MYIELLKEMFNEMVIKKDVSVVPKYFHLEFLLYAHGQVWNYQDHVSKHQKIYKTPIQYAIRYQNETFIEQDEMISGRMFITLSLPNEPDKELELILIVKFKDNKIYRIWELTYPDWTQLETFKKVKD